MIYNNNNNAFRKANYTAYQNFVKNYQLTQQNSLVRRLYIVMREIYRFFPYQIINTYNINCAPLTKDDSITYAQNFYQTFNDPAITDLVAKITDLDNKYLIFTDSPLKNYHLKDAAGLTFEYPKEQRAYSLVHFTNPLMCSSTIVHEIGHLLGFYLKRMNEPRTINGISELEAAGPEMLYHQYLSSFVDKTITSILDYRVMKMLYCALERFYFQDYISKSWNNYQAVIAQYGADFANSLLVAPSPLYALNIVYSYAIAYYLRQKHCNNDEAWQEMQAINAGQQEIDVINDLTTSIGLLYKEAFNFDQKNKLLKKLKHDL